MACLDVGKGEGLDDELKTALASCIILTDKSVMQCRCRTIGNFLVTFAMVTICLFPLYLEGTVYYHWCEDGVLFSWYSLSRNENLCVTQICPDIKACSNKVCVKVGSDTSPHQGVWSEVSQWLSSTYLIPKGSKLSFYQDQWTLLESKVCILF